MMKAVSLFAGIGGFDLAFQRAGITVTDAIELDPKCRAVLARHFPATRLHADIREVRPDELGRPDVMAGGFPCQDISMAGCRAGLAGARSGLWSEFVRLIDGCHPRWVIVENVPGLLSSGGGRDMGAVVGALGELGYGWAYRVLDAQYFGVAQRRKRVFIVGRSGDRRAPVRVLFESDGGEGDSAASGEAPQDIAGTLAARTTGGGYPGTDEACSNHLVAYQCHGSNVGPLGTLRAGSGSVGGGVPFATMPLYYSHDYSGDRIYDALTVARRPNFAVDDAVRTLTPVECERLQGFPDGWTEPHAKTVRYRMLGNAVAVPVAEWLARRLVSEDARVEAAA